jgi:hypothetical protein
MEFPLVFFYFDAFSSREPVPTSLENAMGLYMTRLVARAGDKHSTPDAVHHLPRLRPKYDARKRDG